MHADKIIQKYILDKQIHRALKGSNLPYRKVTKAIDSIALDYPKLTPRICAVGVDTTYFGKSAGVSIFRDVTNNVILHWIFVTRENITTYATGMQYLESQNITIAGIVVDGFRSFYNAYANVYPIQMCQKHMADIVRRHITRRPVLEASQELKRIVDRLYMSSQREFTMEFEHWLMKWENFLKERSYFEGGRWGYTHGRLRRAVFSLKRYLPYLFTYEKYPILPKTNNSIEGFNSGLKDAIRIHRGLRVDRKIKLIHYYLRKMAEFEWGNVKKPTRFVN